MRKIVSSLILAVLCWTVTAHPVRAVDGDTVDVIVETWIGFGSRPVLTPERIRVLGVNTPERGQPGFQEASDYSEAWLMKGDVTLSGCARDTFGRVLATVTRGPDSLADLLIVNLLGVPFKK